MTGFVLRDRCSLGRRQIMKPTTPMEAIASKGRQAMGLPPKSQPQFETMYPYFLYPYLISENDTIAQLKGRVYLDQDTQEAVSSLLSSTVTQARRAAGSYFSKENSDPNDDVLVQKNVYFEQNCLINANVKQFKIDAPDPGIFGAIQSLMVGKQAETSQVAFAVQNRKDSRKTKKELDLAEQTQSQLSTIQVVLFSLALKSQFTYETSIIKSRVLAGLIQVNQAVRPLYDRDFTVKPSGDIDVIERQKLISMMLQFWEIIAQTAAGPLFLADMLEKMFPNSAAKYVQALQQAAQQAQSGQAQQMQAVMGQVMQMAQGIIKLSKEPQFFSDEGRLHAFPSREGYSRTVTTAPRSTKTTDETTPTISSMNPAPLKVTDVAKAQINASQSEWLDNPTTQMALQAITNRKNEYERSLIKRCLTLTDATSDIQDRACISTCAALLKILNDPDLFVRYSTLKTSQ
jgi:hypothetical protein